MFALSGFAALFWQLGVESYTLVSLGLIGAVMAFFFFNVFGSERRGTKTFMGDTGSLVLGYTLAYLAIKYAMNNPMVLAPRPHGMTVVITLLAVPVFDLVRVACMRLLNRKGIFHPDKTHVHHLALAAGFSMTRSLLLILGLQLLIIGVNAVMSSGWSISTSCCSSTCCSTACLSCGCVGDVIARHKPQRNNSTDREAQCLLLLKGSARPFHRFTVHRRASACRIESTTFRYKKLRTCLSAGAEFLLYQSGRRVPYSSYSYSSFLVSVWRLAGDDVDLLSGNSSS